MLQSLPVKEWPFATVLPWRSLSSQNGMKPRKFPMNYFLIQSLSIHSTTHATISSSYWLNMKKTKVGVSSVLPIQPIELAEYMLSYYESKQMHSILYVDYPHQIRAVLWIVQGSYGLYCHWYGKRDSYKFYVDITAPLQLQNMNIQFRTHCSCRNTNSCGEFRWKW